MNRKIVGILVVGLLLIPIFSAAASDPQAPSTPIIHGPCEVELEECCTYIIKSTDPQGDDLHYQFSCSDDPMAFIEVGPFKSGINVTFKHRWCDFYQKSNPFILQVKACDIYGHESEWGIFETNLTDIKTRNKNIINLNMEVLRFLEIIFERFFLIINSYFLENHPRLFPLTANTGITID